MNNCMFKVGQEVWCLIYGKGKVVMVVQPAVYTIKVEFDNVDCQYYTSDGKFCVDGNRTLFFSEPKIEAQEFPSKYAGKTVFLVNNEDGDTDGPFKITKEDTDYVYAREVGFYFYKEDYHIYIVEPEEVVE